MEVITSTTFRAKGRATVSFPTTLSGIRYGLAKTSGTATLCPNNGWKYSAASITTTTLCIPSTSNSMRKKKIKWCSKRSCKVPIFYPPIHKTKTTDIIAKYSLKIFWNNRKIFSQKNLHLNVFTQFLFIILFDAWLIWKLIALLWN